MIAVLFIVFLKKRKKEASRQVSGEFHWDRGSDSANHARGGCPGSEAQPTSLLTWWKRYFDIRIIFEGL